MEEFDLEPLVDGFRRIGGPGNIRRVTSYREFCMKRGIMDYMRFPSRPYRFEFESNEDEERAIAEAIAREEELMRQEEEEKRDDRQWNYPRIIDKYGQVGSAMLHQLSKQPIQFSSNLMPAKEDTSDMKQIKQTLDSLITQVCRWDKQYGWFKSHQKRPRGRMDLDKLKTRRMFSNQRELMLAEHVDRLRKEINKRRTRLENEAEKLAGMSTPWRKAKSKSSKNNQQHPMPSYSMSACSSISDFLEQLPKFASEEEDWRQFGYLLDCGSALFHGVVPDEDPLASEEEEGRLVIKAKIRNQSPAVKDVNKAPAAPVAPARVVNPAEISLGGDSLTDWPPAKEVKQDEEDLVEDTQPPMKRVKLEVIEANSDSGSPRKKAIIPISDRVLRTRTNSHSEAEEGQSNSGKEQKKRGRPRKDATQNDGSNKSEESDVGENPVPEGMKNPNDPHCICRKPYNPRKFYISCDACSCWFHGKCVGVTEEATKTMSGWMCAACEEEAAKANATQALYCICQTPYDDELFYVGCDGCEDWFHPECVGITKEFAESIGEYMCPRCVEQQMQEPPHEGDYESDASTSSVSVPLSRADYPLVWRILEVVGEHRMAWPFRDPVDTTQFPTYNEVIHTPMDLSTIQKKLEKLEYIHLKDFIHDMNQMFENARIFNTKESSIYMCADTLEKIFEQQLAEVKAEMANRREQDRRKPSESHTVDSSLDIDTDQLLGDVQLDIDPSMYDQLF